MAENKLISSKSIIAKIIADNDMSEDDLRITDIKEWIGEAMEKIGAIQLLEHKNTVIPIVCHLAKLPCDLYKLDLVGYSSNLSGGWFPMRKATGSFSIPTLHSEYCDSCCDKYSDCMLMPDDALIPLVKNMFNLTDDRTALDILNNDPNIRLTLGGLLNQYTVPTVNGRFVGTNGNTSYNDSLQYVTKPGYIVTLNKSGYVNISYYAIITDEDAMPMIPDNISYTEAIYWYVTMKLEFPNYKNGKMPRHVYYDIKNSWNFYRKQAYGEAMLPSGSDDLHTIQNTWLKIYPEIGDHDTFYSTTGQVLQIYNLNY